MTYHSRIKSPAPVLPYAMLLSGFTHGEAKWYLKLCTNENGGAVMGVAAVDGEGDVVHHYLIRPYDGDLLVDGRQIRAESCCRPQTPSTMQH